MGKSGYYSLCSSMFSIPFLSSAKKASRHLILVNSMMWGYVLAYSIARVAKQ